MDIHEIFIFSFKYIFWQNETGTGTGTETADSIVITGDSICVYLVLRLRGAKLLIEGNIIICNSQEKYKKCNKISNSTTTINQIQYWKFCHINKMLA